MFSKMKQWLEGNVREINRLKKLVEHVNKWEEKIQQLTDEQLQEKTEEFKERIQNGESLNSIAVEAFSIVREAAKRVVGQRHYDVQILGGFVLNQNNIAEMYTGEGKTLVATLPSYLHALEGHGVHVITANEYLATRDCEFVGQIHRFLGLTVGLNISQLSPEEKSEAYAADITYGTGTEFGFDYLRDNIVHDTKQKVQRPLHYAIVDEVDSILIDEARTPLIIANKSAIGAELFGITAQLMKKFIEDVDYELYLETKQLFLADEGAKKIEAAFGIDNLYDAEHQPLLHNVMQSLRAYALMSKDVDYIIREGKILLVDQFTGRIMDGRTFSDGLHQAIEAKEDVEVTEENDAQAMITVQNYFRMYKTLSGMTGSATPSKEEFWETYTINVVSIPPNKPTKRTDAEDLLFATYEQKAAKIVAEVQKIHAQGRPILIGTTSITQSERLSKELQKNHITHKVLNAKTVEDEARIISLAGQKNSIIISTNMAGRGTDILLGEGIAELGGLHIIGTERHESNRIDMQLRGRAGRQGDPGSSQFIVSLEDDLFKYYEKEDMDKWKKKMVTNTDGLITSPDPLKFIRLIQETIEYSHQASRNHLLKLDNVLDQQSKVIYQARDTVLYMEEENLLSTALGYVKQYMLNIIADFMREQQATEQGDTHKLHSMLSLLFFSVPFTETELRQMDLDQLEKTGSQLFNDLCTQLEGLGNDAQLHAPLRQLMIQTIDSSWIQFLHHMTDIRDGAHLRSYSMEDPYRQFEFEAFNKFKVLQQQITADIAIWLCSYIRSQYDIDNEGEEHVIS